MFKIILSIIVLAWIPQNAQKPIPLNWMELQRVKTKPVSIEGVDGFLPLPVFPKNILAYNGKYVEVDGYIIPIDKTGKIVALSSFPMAECFFCGKAGPASVMTIKLKTPNKKYKTDQIATFIGIMRLNEKDPKELFYVLENAEDISG